MRPPKRGTFLKKLVLLASGLLLAAMIGEAGLRIIGYSHPIFYASDYDRGYALRPGVEGRYQQEGDSYVVINSDGWRDRERQKTKPANTVRIAVIGDSFTEAMHVPFEQTFCVLLEKKLPECNAFSGRQVEVLNLGVSGYGTAQELITLRQKVWEYSPDIVLLVFTTYNDLYDNSRALGKNEAVPYFVYRNGELVYDASFRDSANYRKSNSSVNKLGRWLNDHLRVAQLIEQTYVVARLRLSQWRSPSAPFWTNGEIYREPQNDDWREAWHVTEELIKQMRDEVEQRGTKFLFVTGSNPIQVYPDARERESFMRQIGQTSLFYPNLRLKAMAEREHIDFMDLAAPMQAYVDQNKVLLHSSVNGIGNGHWNAAGHRVVADLIAEKLCRQAPTAARTDVRKKQD
jgi:hypothetical protein